MRTKPSTYTILWTCIFTSLFFFSPLVVFAKCENLKPPFQFTAITYNIRTASLGMDKILGVLEKQKADFVFLQEVHGPAFTQGFVDQADYLGKFLHMNFIFGRTRYWLSGEYGIALLSRFPLSEIEKIPLPNFPGEEPEILLMAKAQTPKGPLLLANVHLISKTRLKNHSEKELRFLQAQKIIDIFLHRSGPILFGGDLNTFGNAGVISLFFRYLDDVFGQVGKGRKATFPASLPLARIDYFLIRGAVTPLAARVLNSQASDHRPLWAKLEISQCIAADTHPRAKKPKNVPKASLRLSN